MNSAHRIELSLGVERHSGVSGPLFGPGHALFLGLLRSIDPETSQLLHDADRRKPFALGPLMVTARGRAVAEASLVVRVWDDALAGQIRQALERALAIRLQVRGSPTLLLDVRAAPPVELAALEKPPCGHAVAVRFETPTFFSLGRRFGRQQYGVLPDGEAVVRSWLRAWSAAADAPAGVPEDLTGRVAIRWVRDLKTVVVKGQKTALTGFVGEAMYAWVGPEPDGPRLLTALARFSAYCGTGAKTGYGFGVTTPIQFPRSSPDE